MTAPATFPATAAPPAGPDVRFGALMLATGAIVLAALWLGPLPERAAGSFAAHMVLHMGIVAIAAPILALAFVRLLPQMAARLTPAVAIAAAMLEFLAVWSWHAPGLHDAARVDTGLYLAEQASFLLAGFLVWASAFGSVRGDLLASRLAGTAALLITSMHMTLLGALLLFAPRPLYACAELCAPAARFTPLGDQQLGGVVMLSVGGVVYLAGGLALLASVLGRGASNRGAAG